MQKTDDDLIRLALNRDTDAFNELVIRWEKMVYALAYRVLGNKEDAHDVCQEAFIRAYGGLKNFKGQSKFSSWLYRITLNLCHDWLRRERRMKFVQPSDELTLKEQQQVNSSSETIEDRVIRRDLDRVVSKAIATLPENQRVVIVLKEYHGLTFREIADVLECPLSTVKTRLYQGLRILKQRLESVSSKTLASTNLKLFYPRIVRER